VLGLAVGAPADLDVEHVDLAVDGLQVAARPGVHGRVGPALPALHALGHRARDDVDAELARRRPGPCDGGAVERLGGRRGLLRRAEHRPLLGEHDELGTLGGGLAGEAVRGREVALAIRCGMKLDGGGAHRSLPPSGID
jgi:hypothetical protein